MPWNALSIEVSFFPSFFFSGKRGRKARTLHHYTIIILMLWYWVLTLYIGSYWKDTKNYKAAQTTTAHIPLLSMPFYVSYSLIFWSPPASCDGQHLCFESSFSMFPCLYMPFVMGYASSGLTSIWTPNSFSFLSNIILFHLVATKASWH